MWTYVGKDTSQNLVRQFPNIRRLLEQLSVEYGRMLRDEDGGFGARLAFTSENPSREML
jgi:hypothetical protein